MLVLEELQVGNLVTSESIDNLVLRQEVGNLGRSLLVLLQLCQHILSLLGVLGWWVGNAVKFAVKAGDVVGHVCVLEEFDLAGKDLLRQGIVTLLLSLLAVELDQWEEQVPAQVRRDAGHDRAISRDGGENIRHIERFDIRRFRRG